MKVLAYKGRRRNQRPIPLFWSFTHWDKKETWKPLTRYTGERRMQKNIEDWEEWEDEGEDA